MQQLLVSFIIPYFNAGSTIQETIDSVLNQSYPNYDIWIVNDGSTEPESIEKLKELEQHERITVLHQENAGPGSARNLAANKSKADYFVFIDADDLIYPDALDFLITEIHEIDYVLYGNSQYFGERNGAKKQVQSSLIDILVGNPIALCCLIKSSSFKKIQFDVKLDKIGLEDWELFISMFAANMNLRYIDSRPLFKIRVRNFSRTYSVANQRKQEVINYISLKHSKIIYHNYLSLHQELKYQKSSIEHKIGFNIMKPYRLIKKYIFK